MDIEKLMTQQGMRDYTDGQRDSLIDWAGEVRQLAQIAVARLANTHIEGDTPGSAGRRARKVGRQFTKVARLLEKAAAQTEAVNAVYGREVLQLPDRRAKDLERKATRRQRLGIAASSVHAKTVNSLTTSTHTLHGIQQPTTQQVNGMPQPVQYVNPHPHRYTGAGPQQPVGDIGDYFPEAL